MLCLATRDRDDLRRPPAVGHCDFGHAVRGQAHLDVARAVFGRPQLDVVAFDLGAAVVQWTVPHQRARTACQVLDSEILW